MGCGGSKDETASPNDVVLAAAPAARPRAGSNASEPRSSMVGGIFKSAGRRPSQDEEEGVEYDMQGRRIVEIGMPTNFQHVMHMGWTAEGGFKVEEMPTNNLQNTCSYFCSSIALAPGDTVHQRSG